MKFVISIAKPIIADEPMCHECCNGRSHRNMLF